MILLQVHLQKPCYDFLILQMIWFTPFSILRQTSRSHLRAVHDIYRIIQSIEATGGVYKGQGHNQHQLMTYAYQEFLVYTEKLQAVIPVTTSPVKFTQVPQIRNSLYLSLQRACSPGHLRASQTCYCFKLPHSNRMASL